MSVAESTLPAGSLIFAEVDTGISAAADHLRRLTRDVARRFSEPAVAFGPGEARRALAEVYREASLANWDGYGARPVTADIVGNAEFFLSLIPTTVPAPEISVDPDGEISVEWRVASGRVFSVSVGPGRRLTHAGLFGRSTSHGTEYLVSELPRAISENLRRLFAET
jgi:hypothetical protein